jgi:hypothetical protein
MKIDSKANSKTWKPQLKKPSMISHHLVVLIGLDSAELWWFVVRPRQILIDPLHAWLPELQNDYEQREEPWPLKFKYAL